MQKIGNRLSRLLYRPREAPAQYHLWYYNSLVWRSTQWMGVPAQKSVSDMWNYQEILFSLKPSLLIEFGTSYGGSALFFAMILRQIGNPFQILSVDVDDSFIREPAKNDPNIELMKSSSADPAVAAHIQELKSRFPGPIFAILDSDHTKAHVLAEMLLLRPLLSRGDYVIVEDSDINGHPVLPLWGDGPYEAVEEYVSRFPNDYVRDVPREKKFGFTSAPHGFLIRQ
ncbi:MAG TPA: CmcI family methyltransferase [Candidatus Angelobacter sp.]|nr:CmcI family methyltransferase [Candidatus Angelobacter sp.]